MATVPEEELLVFGYACKLFRDDEKAAQVEKEEFSVPWMGDSSFRIDRFDCRGTLSNLKKHEPLGHSVPLEDYLSPEDVQLEQICEHERYRALKIADEAEEAFKKEESEKRAASGAEIGFSYDQNNGQSSSSQGNKVSSEISLRQLATVIEKTSEFIATQGAQMEILMRAKEAHNPKFQFLNPGNPYHSIYKQVLEKKKARASGKLLENLPEVPSLDEVEQSLKNLTRNLPSAAPGLSTSDNSDSSNAYSQLVKRLKVNLVPPPPPITSQPPPPPPGKFIQCVEITEF